MLQNPKLYLWLTLVGVLALQLTNLQHSFFWDTVQLGSTHATFFYENGFSSWLLPDGVDSGHIPAFGAYLALIWKIFGRTLAVSHLAMVPFALGAVWQLYRLCAKFIDKKYAGAALLLIALDPTLLSQFTLVSPDVPLVCFFLLATNAVLENRKKLFALAAVLLFLTSMRGMMCVVCLLLLDLYVNFTWKKWPSLMRLLERSLLYWPAVIVFVLFNAYHFYYKGWIGYHQDSPWADCFAPVDARGLLFNIALYGWRLLDFGRVVIWVVGIILLLRFGKRLLTPYVKPLMVLAVALLVLLPANMLWAKNLLAHRYLLPVYLIVALFVAAMLFNPVVGKRMRLILSVTWLAVLVSGNFWIYPPRISQGWDSTIAHLPYYDLRMEAIGYLDEQKIDYRDVQSFFPNIHSRDFQELNGQTRHFENFDGTAPYVFYSNVYNVEDADYDRLFANYHIVREFRCGRIFVSVMKRNP